MSSRSFDIASGKYTQRQTQKGSGYNRKRVSTLQGTGLGRDVIASIVSAVLPKAVSALTDYATPKLVQKIKGSGKKQHAGSWKLH